MQPVSSQGLPCCCCSARTWHRGGTWLTLMYQNTRHWHQLEFGLLSIWCQIRASAVYLGLCVLWFSEHRNV